jgi:hypothetical protein
VVLLRALHAMSELGGHACAPGREAGVPASAQALPAGLARWVDEGVFEAEQHEALPLPAAEGARVRELVGRASAAWW